MARIEIEPGLLWRLGYRNLTRSEVASVLHEIYEALEWAVGARIAAQLNHRQLEEFERLVGSGAEERVASWLSDAVPNYSLVVDDEYHLLQRRLEGAIALARRQSRMSTQGEA